VVTVGAENIEGAWVIAKVKGPDVHGLLTG
jgi:hypothetical protein